MLIVEGPDLVGKTTLCNSLLQNPYFFGHGFTYRHLTILPSGFDYYWGYIDLISERVIQDRFHLSQRAYHEVTRPGLANPLTHEKQRLVDAKLRLIGAVTVVITAEPELITSRFKTEREMFTLKEVLEVNERYMNHFDMDVDFHIHCTEKLPFPTVQDMEDITAFHKQRHQLKAELLRTAYHGPL